VVLCFDPDYVELFISLHWSLQYCGPRQLSIFIVVVVLYTLSTICGATPQLPLQCFGKYMCMSLLPESVISPCYLLQRAKFQ